MPEIETALCRDPEDTARVESKIANKGKYRAFSHIVAPPGHPREIPDGDVAIISLCK
jgi:hypothetical protein